jgi:Skp family chaperone for outer membrane proteins
MTRTFLTIMVLLLAVSAAFSQNEVGPIKSSPAYSEVLLRKTQLQADLEAFLADYTEQNPKILDIRAELTAINKSMERIFAVKPSETGKLTLALGKLIVQQAAAETDLARLLRSYNNDHPQVKRARRRVEIFDNAIAEILK